jgi:hypothetical protein
LLWWREWIAAVLQVFLRVVAVKVRVFGWCFCGVNVVECVENVVL